MLGGKFARLILLLIFLLAKPEFNYAGPQRTSLNMVVNCVPNAIAYQGHKVFFGVSGLLFFGGLGLILKSESIQETPQVNVSEIVRVRPLTLSELLRAKLPIDKAANLTKSIVIKGVGVSCICLSLLPLLLGYLHKIAFK